MGGEVCGWVVPVKSGLPGRPRWGQGRGGVVWGERSGSTCGRWRALVEPRCNVHFPLSHVWLTTNVTVLADSMTLANQSAARSCPGAWPFWGDCLHPPLPNTGKVFARALVSHARRIDRTLPDAMEIRMSRGRRERSPEQDASRFIDLVSGGGFWQSVDLRVCAIRSGRRWMNLVTRGFLDHRPLDRSHAFHQSSGTNSVHGRSFVRSRTFLP